MAKQKKTTEPFIPAWLALLVGLAIVGVLGYFSIKDGTIYAESNNTEHAPADAEKVFFDNEYAYCYWTAEPQVYPGEE